MLWRLEHEVEEDDDAALLLLGVSEELHVSETKSCFWVDGMVESQAVVVQEEDEHVASHDRTFIASSRLAQTERQKLYRTASE